MTYFIEDCIDHTLSYLDNADLLNVICSSQLLYSLGIKYIDWRRPRRNPAITNIEHIIAGGHDYVDIEPMLAEQPHSSRLLISLLMSRRRDYVSDTFARGMFAAQPYGAQYAAYFDMMSMSDYIERPNLALSIISATQCNVRVVKVSTLHKILRSPRAADILEAISRMPSAPRIAIRNISALMDTAEPNQIPRLLAFTSGIMLHYCLMAMNDSDEEKIKILIEHFKPCSMSDFSYTHFDVICKLVPIMCPCITPRELNRYKASKYNTSVEDAPIHGWSCLISGERTSSN